jgi:carboxypeptidase Taq
MPSPDSTPAAYAALRERLAELDDLGAAMHVAGWDQETMMPPGGAGARGEVLATLNRLAHDRMIDDGLLAALDELGPWAASLGEDDDAAAIVRVVRRDVERARRVPSELTARITRAGSEALVVWKRAREEDDFASFAPYLERNLDLRRELAACFPDAEHPYDALLDDYEPGMTTAAVRATFAELSDGLVPLIAEVSAAEQPPALRGPFDVVAQRALALEMVRSFGFEEEHWRLDDSVHPFSQSVAPSDVRVTARFVEHEISGLFAVMHEVGHGLYERQQDPALARTGLGTGVSMGIHESQSRLWENLVGRSRPFWSHWLPRAQERLPALQGQDLDAFLRSVNAVRPSLIRVDADEATYSLHIILRFELEVALIEGDLAVADLPAAWNERMRHLLGIDVPDDRRGVLQDIHWAFGDFGYFPTYALGNIAAAQLWDASTADLPGLQDDLARGELGPLRDWLGEHVHRVGRRLQPAELLERVTGAAYDPDPLLRQLRAKFADLYRVGAAD